MLHRSARRPLVSILALEPRLMFDGAAVAAAADHADNSQAQQSADANDAPSQNSDSADTSHAQTAAEAAAAAASAQPQQAQNSAPHEVAFVDPSVQNVDTLLAGLREGVEVVMLDPAKDQLAQIADWAKDHSGYDAIYILGHGQNGTLLLGSLDLTAANVADHAADLATIGGALTPDGDLLFYGCNSGAGAAGQALADALAAATGADVALSDDLTGAATRGGDWVLETHSGDIQATLPLTQATAENYQGLLAEWSGTITFDSGDGGSISNAGDTGFTGSGTAVYTIGGYSLTGVVSADGSVITDLDFPANGDKEFGLGSSNAGASSIAFKFTNDEYFDISGLTLINYSGQTTKWTITGKANGVVVATYTMVTGAADQASTVITLTGFTGVTLIEFTPNTGVKSLGLDDIAISRLGYSPGPAVTDAKINITSTGSGTSGAYKIGDTVTATWNNTAAGDNNSGITGVTFDFSQFGGGSAVTATNSGGVWSASYTITAGSIDAINRNVSVTATGSGTTTTADTTNLTVDNQAPTVTDGNVSISGGTGTSGAYKAGDTVTATWDNRASGDNNTDTLSSVTFDFSAFGGGSAVSASNSGGIWTATYLITAGSIDAANRNVSVTVTDNAGNATSRADTTTATVDNQAPTVTDGNVSISGGSGTSGAYKTGDTVTATWDNRASGDNNSDTISGVTFDFSAFGGGSAVSATNSGGIWTATYLIAAGSLNGVTNRNVSVTVTDNAGNATTRADTTNATVDNQVPTITGVTSSTANGGYKAGDTISIQVSFGENVTITGTPTLALNSGGTASYDSGSGTGTLTFLYVVQAGDTAADLDFTSTSALSGGTIRDASGNNATLTLPSPGTAGSLGANKNIVIDTAAPSVTGVTSSTADATYKVGDTISIQVNFSENVTVTGTPTLTLNSGRTVNYSTGSGTSTLTFTYTVGAGDTAADLDFASVSALALSGGTIADTAHNNATLTLPTPGTAGSLGANKDLVVDGIAPAVSGNVSVPSDTTYGAGQDLDFTVTFDDTVTVNGTGSTLTLNIGGVTRQATYLSKTGTTVTYRYTVQVGDSDSDGIAVTGLALNGDTIRDAAGNDASLGLSGHLPSLTGVLVDAALPAIFGNVSVADGSYKEGTVLTFTVPLNKSVTVDTSGGSPTLDLTIGSTTRTAVYDAAASTATSLVFKYTVQTGETDSDGIAINAVDVNGAVIEDSHGNTFDNTLTGHLPSLAGVLVDTTAPGVTSVSVPTDNNYGAGDSLTFTVNYDEAVVVDTSGGTPRIAITLDTGGTVYATYVSGSGTSALVFSYTVPVGNYTDGDGITVGALALNGGTLRDTAGNDAALTLNGVADTSGVLVDGRSPVVTSVTAPANGTYTSSQTVSFTVNFDGAVTVDTTGGTPRVAITLDTGGTVYADYASGSGTTALVFSYTVTNGNQDLDGVTLGALSLNGGTLRNAAGNNAVLTINNPDATSGVLVDARAPTVSSVSVPTNRTYGVGQSMDFTVNYDEAVTVDTTGGTPRIAVTLDTGGTVYADYVSGSGTTALVFRLQPQIGQEDTTGVTVGMLGLNGGTIRDAASNDATTTLNSVASATQVLVDGIAPDAPTVTVPSTSNTASVTIGGTAEANATVRIYDNGVLVGTTTANGSGNWTTAVTLADGARTVTAIAVDAAGNIGPASSPETVTVTSPVNNGSHQSQSSSSDESSNKPAPIPVTDPGVGGLKTFVRESGSSDKPAGMETVVRASGVGVMGQFESGTQTSFFSPPAESFKLGQAPKPAGGGDVLIVNTPIPNAAFGEGNRISVTIPANAFAHSSDQAVVNLQAVQANGTALPGWLGFNPRTGTFEGTPPPGFKGAVTVKVVARDRDGREAVQTFNIVVGRGDAAPAERGQAPGRSGQAPMDGNRHAALMPAGRPSLTDQLRSMSQEGRIAQQMALFGAKGGGKAA